MVIFEISEYITTMVISKLEKFSDYLDRHSFHNNERQLQRK